MKVITDTESKVILINNSGQGTKKRVDQWVLYHTGEYFCIGMGNDYVEDRLACDLQVLAGLINALLKLIARNCPPLEHLIMAGTLNKDLGVANGARKPIASHSQSYMYRSNLSTRACINAIDISSSLGLTVIINARSCSIALEVVPSKLVELTQAICEMVAPRIQDHTFFDSLLKNFEVYLQN